MANLMKVDDRYEDSQELQTYREVTSASITADWLAECTTVADWAEVETDLVCHRAPAEGVVLRHILEHDEMWPDILANAVASFTKRLVIVLSTPILDDVAPAVKALAYDMMAPLPRPTLSFSWTALFEIVPARYLRAFEAIDSPTPYGRESILLFEKPAVRATAGVGSQPRP